MRICFIGDSFVNGTGDPTCLGWTGRICAAARRAGHDVTHYNLGIRGNTSTHIAKRWRRETDLRLPPDLDGRLVFSYGVNDCILENGVPPAHTLANTKAILAEATLWKPTLFVGPPPADPSVNPQIQSLSQALAALCEEANVPYLDTFLPLCQSAPWLNEAAANDGAHPGQGGYEALAALVLAWSGWTAWFSD